LSNCRQGDENACFFDKVLTKVQTPPKFALTQTKKNHIMLFDETDIPASVGSEGFPTLGLPRAAGGLSRKIYKNGGSP
jgi:hypothetical protein